MRFAWFFCLVVASLAFGQAAPAKPSTAPGPVTAPGAAAPQPAKTVAPEETVLTIKGVCADAGKQGEDCKTTISRAEFDKLTDAIQPNMPPGFRRNFANQYATALIMAAAAEKRGLDKQPMFETLMHLARLQNLSRELRRALQEDANKISDQDFEDYYRKNSANFEQAEILKLYVPRSKQIVSSKADETEEGIAAEQKAGEAAMSKLAETLHARAAKGEDFATLQKEAFEAAGFKGVPPDVKMSKVRRTTLPPKQVAAMDLKPGEVSQLISDPSGYYVFKMVSKENLPLDAVKEEIRGTISSQRYREAMQAFQKTDNAELNDAYFGAAPKPPAVRGGKAPEQGEEDHK